MRANMVHQAAEHLRGIIFHNGKDFLHHGGGVRAGQPAEHRAAERIVHHAVELAAQQVTPSLAVGGFVRRVFPDLAEHQSVRLFRFRGGAQAVEKTVGQLVGNVEPPAGSARPQPAADDPVRPVYKAGKVRVPLVDGRQRGKIPPAVVVARPGAEPVPGIIRRSLRLAGPGAGVTPLPVKVDAVAPRMIENAVEQHTDAKLRRCRTQRAKVFLRAEQRIDFSVIRRVVPVVRVRLKHRVEVQAGNPERLQVRELPLNSAQVSSEIIAVCYFPVRVRRPVGLLPPRRVKLPVGRNARFFLTGTAKTVGENLVHHATRQPFRCCEAGVKHRQLPRRPAAAELALAAAAARHGQRTAPSVGKKTVKIQAGLFRRKVALPEFPVAVHPAPEHAHNLLGAARVIRYRQAGGGTVQPARQGDFKVNCRSGGYRPCRAAARRIA